MPPLNDIDFSALQNTGTKMDTNSYTPQEIRQQQQREVERKLMEQKERRISDVGDLAILDPEDVTLGQFDYHGAALRRVDPIKYAIIQRNLLTNFVKSQMIRGHDYGVIPFCGDKPALFKAGAERLATLFNYSVTMDCTSKHESFEGNGLFSYTYKATVRTKDGGVFECEANCNSKEKKYAYRWVKEQYATAPEKESAISRKNGALQVPNDDIFSIVNTIMKMSEKRAFVGAIILACNATGFFENAETIAENRVPEGRPTWDGNTIDAEIVPDEPRTVERPTKPGHSAPNISEKQIARMMALASAAGYTENAVKAVVAQAGFTSRRNIPNGQAYESICATLGTDDQAIVKSWNDFALVDPQANIDPA